MKFNSTGKENLRNKLFVRFDISSALRAKKCLYKGQGHRLIGGPYQCQCVSNKWAYIKWNDHD